MGFSDSREGRRAHQAPHEAHCRCPRVSANNMLILVDDGEVVDDEMR